MVSAVMENTEQNVPRVFIQMSGPPGSGKSTTSKLLAPALNAVVLDHDIIRSTVLEHGIAFSQAAKLAYDLGWALAEDILKQGRGVIIDSPCNYQEAIDRGTALAQNHGFEYWYVECKVDDVDLLDQRLQQRTALRSQRTRIAQPPSDAVTAPPTLIKTPCRPKRDCIILDTPESPEERRDRVLRQIRSISER